MAKRETPAPEAEASPTNPLLTRRRVLGGMAGVAALGGVSAFLAACSGGATPSPSASTGPAPSTGGGSSPAPSTGGGSPAATGSVTLGSNYSDAVPKGVLAGIV